MVQLCARHPGACRRSPCAGLLHRRRVCCPARRDFGVATGNVSQRVRGKLGRNLHLTTGHPLNTIKRTIEQHFEKQQGDTTYAFFDSLPPQVSVKSNFDDLLIPPDHPSREPTDTFYLDDGQVLRTHTSAHQVELMQAGHRAFLCTGDVYRRDTVDRTHYPVFHQTEGLRIFEEWGNGEDACERVEEDMRHTLNGLARALFGDVPTRWNPDYFPFTEPSWELEILFNGEWTEVLGCGVVRQEILQSCGHGHARAWAFGLGLERLAMILFNIPDIRLFWSEDSRFNDQVGLHHACHACMFACLQLQKAYASDSVMARLAQSSNMPSQVCTKPSQPSYHTASIQSATKMYPSGWCVPSCDF
jgi:phenylalanyl-tRNA synthetase alpha chain